VLPRSLLRPPQKQLEVLPAALVHWPEHRAETNMPAIDGSDMTPLDRDLCRKNSCIEPESYLPACPHR
jgi:hypothetical protein